jgi:CRP-like cAMP-binding protein
VNFSAPKNGSLYLEEELRRAGRGPSTKPGVLQIRARPFDSDGTNSREIEDRLSADEQDLLLSIATVVECRRGGSPIYSEGEVARFVYSVGEGIVRTSRCAENGHRQILAFRAPGDLFGFPDGGRYANSAETVGPAKLYRLPWHRLQQMLLAEPQLQLIVLEKMAHDFRQAQNRIMSLGQQNTYQRLAAFILEWIYRPDFFDEKKSLLKFPVNRFDLADYIGTAPESAARAFAKLEHDGLVRRINFKEVEILDIEGLQALRRGHRRSHCAVREGQSELTS